MFKELGSIASMLKQAKTMGPKMQAQMEEVAKQRVSGTAGGGMITVEATGASEIVSVKIDPVLAENCLLYTSPSPRDGLLSRMPSSA